ncbi:PepSY-associated TM helix domain-containing protein [Vibrio navarrensis]|uniref:PepSY-associated TM helix domain-containing protein n=1 Tax=Vibrio navarrensis TaxID=29495 RepID=UPI00051D1715|nr:PepSY-associated TM helix domain-containing protein [Vibrio navarrensis]EHA1125348.1 peptidase [Vibrio navarrensis]KGK12741.1 peptidase [Vibrio navarrensis]KGK22700.1 peptidase [Vibrio navarrensis]
MFYKHRAFQLWARRLHIYVSMALLGLMLFFALTGITLNRPDLFVSSHPQSASVQLDIPQELLFQNGQVAVDKRTLAQFLTEQTFIPGAMSDLDIYSQYEGDTLKQGEVSASFNAPGYSAALFIDLVTAQAELDVTDYGWVARLNDLHKGRHSGEAWKWLIDASALLMLVFILSGVALLLPKKSTLSYALRWCSAGLVLTVAVYLWLVP